jgi:hypothetical protein
VPIVAQALAAFGAALGIIGTGVAYRKAGAEWRPAKVSIFFTDFV